MIAPAGTAWGIKHTQGTLLRPAGANAKLSWHVHSGSGRERRACRALFGCRSSRARRGASLVGAFAIAAKQATQRRPRKKTHARTHARRAIAAASRAESEVRAHAMSWPTRAEKAHQCVHAMQSHKTYVGVCVGVKDGCNVWDYVADDCLTVM